MKTFGGGALKIKSQSRRVIAPSCLLRAAHCAVWGFSVANGAFSRRTSPIRNVTPSRSKYSNKAMVYLRLDPRTSRKAAALISPFSASDLQSKALTFSTDEEGK